MNRQIDVRKTYGRINKQWYSANEIHMDNKHPARFTIIENGSVFHFETPIKHTAGSSGKTVWKVKQAEKPTLDKPIINSVSFQKHEKQLVAKWHIPASASPQMGYRIDLFDNDKLLSSYTEMLPHIRLKSISMPAKANRAKLPLWA